MAKLLLEHVMLVQHSSQLFQVLLNTTDTEINSFVSNTHSGNSGRTQNTRIILSPSTVIGLQSIRFELKAEAEVTHNVECCEAILHIMR